MTYDPSNTRPVTFIAPDPQAISDYARKVYAEYETEGKGSSKDSVHTGFSSFLAFVATKLTKYLNEGHTELLDKYKGQKTIKEVHHVAKNHKSQNHSALLYSKIVDKR